MHQNTPNLNSNSYFEPPGLLGGASRGLNLDLTGVGFLFGCSTFALGTFAPPYFGTFAPPYFGTSATPQPGTFAPPYFGTFALPS